MSDIWLACQGDQQKRLIAGQLHRVVENQEQVATLDLVDTLEEQALLEALLEPTKPPPPANTDKLHYLLKTPFRYPPLPWGSRFGGCHEPSLFYGARSLTTALAETAFYRLVFWSGMSIPPPRGRIRSEHHAFQIGYRAARGVQLHLPPFIKYKQQISHPADYHMSRPLGTAMRDAGVDAFEFLSARCSKGGINVALFTPRVLTERRPRRLTPWLCETTADSVAFKNLHNVDGLHHFSREQFLFQGHWPQPQ